jgi:hypothetical protein
MLASTLAVAALLLSGLAAATSVRQLREARKANAFPATVDLFREYRSEQMVAARRLLSRRLVELDHGKGIQGMPDDVARAALKLAHYFDNLGVQVEHRLIPADIVAGFLGDSALRLWSQLEPFIFSERELRSPNSYLEYFEHLATVLHDLQPMRARAGLLEWQERQRPGPTPSRSLVGRSS